MENTQAPLDAPKVIRIGRVQLTFNVIVQAIVVIAIVAMANYLSLRHYARFDLSRNKKFTLSEQTKVIAGGLTKPVQAIIFFAGEGEPEANCRQLLREYEFASRGKITVEEVSPYQNLTRARELQTKYKFGANENIVILDYEGKSKFINSADMAELEQLDQMAMMTGRRPQMIAFKGEQLLTNALLELTEAKQNKVYILGGHGEYDFNAKQNTLLKEQLGRQNIKAEALMLANLEKVPDDASALIILSPRFDYTERDLKLLTEYWDRKGRLFIAIGPVGKRPGLDNWLASRGVQPMNDTVLRVVNLGGITGMMELEGIIMRGSPITKSLEDVGLTLVGQTESLRLDRVKETTDQLQFAGLLTAPEGFWGETEYTADRRSVPFFDPKKDNAAPLTLAVAVEKGASRDPNVKLATSRMVVFGNGDLLSLDGLRAGPVGMDLATNAFNWLLNRDNLIAIPAKPKQNAQISLSENQLIEIAKWVTLFIPVIIGIFGLYYLWARSGKSVLRLTMIVAFALVLCWVLWRLLLGYLGTPEGKKISRESLIFVGAVFVIGTIAFVLQKALRRKSQSQRN
jgi:hypothetical protein